MKVLVITRGSWNPNNNIGNTVETFFNGFPNCEIHNLYFRSEIPGTSICKTIYQISEQSLIKNFFSGRETGHIITQDTIDTSETICEEALYNSLKKLNFSVLWFIRELIWTFGHWKKNLENYLRQMGFDMVFMPVFGCWYPHKVLAFIVKSTKANVILFHADDNYSLKQFSLSPLYWIYRFRLRHWVRKSVSISCANYCISSLQANEYQRVFHVPFELLCKWADFSGELQQIKKPEKPFQLVFTGNISSGRWKTLMWIGESLDRINQDEIKAQLLIYTSTPLTEKMNRCLTEKKSILMMGCVPASKISQIQKNADVLVHVESFSLKDKLEVRLSFSTKIVDYLSRGRCILAVGPADVASIDFFIQNDAGIVVTQKKMIEEALLRMLNDSDTLTYYARKAWEAGKRNYNEAELKQNFFERINSLINGTSDENTTGKCCL